MASDHPLHPARPTHEAERVRSLDGLRAVSIAIVLFAHLTTKLSDENRLIRFIDLALLDRGHLGVEIFFAISGFIITHLLLKERFAAGAIDMKGFYLRRAARILPLYWLAISVMAVCWRLGWLQTSVTQLASSALFVANYGHEHKPHQLGHVWSLCVEEQFYLFWPLLFSRLTLASARRFALLLALGGPLVRVASYYLLPGFRTVLLYQGHTNMDVLMWGCVAAIYMNSPGFELARKTWLSGKTVLGLLSAAFALQAIRFLTGSSAASAVARSLLPTFDGLASALAILWLLDQRPRALDAFLNHHQIVRIGTLSYSIYIWQQFFLPECSPRAWAQLPANVFLIAIAAVLSHVLIERPARRFFNGSRRPAAVESTPLRQSA